MREDLGVSVVEGVTVVDGPDDFCRRLHPKLVGALRLYLGDVELAHELAQEALVRVIERWDRVRAMEQPEAWTYRVAFNLARSGLRRRGAERRAHARRGPDPEAARVVELAEVIAVREAVAALAPRQREAVVLRYFGDLPLTEVALAMGCRPGTVKAHLHQGLAALRASGLTTDLDDPVEPDPSSASLGPTPVPLSPGAADPTILGAN